ncbi:hypothetical protein ANN_13621 [Periplaneta americana]|uniref:Reverse transcriptase domain-containing protein n=1 Tax=Periplaneta americana TaxID=6978 RepID=A0ABQ8TK35_PERAM|nr:hypothetical protein ANN_13621 [Periplaneta americana]
MFALLTIICPSLVLLVFIVRPTAMLSSHKSFSISSISFLDLANRTTSSAKRRLVSFLPSIDMPCLRPQVTCSKISLHRVSGSRRLVWVICEYETKPHPAFMMLSCEFAVPELWGKVNPAPCFTTKSSPFISTGFLEEVGGHEIPTLIRGSKFNSETQFQSRPQLLPMISNRLRYIIHANATALLSLVQLNGLHQLLIYVDDVNMLAENPQTIRENTGILLEASKEIGLEVNPEKTNAHVHQRRLRVFENKVLRKIFGDKRDEFTGEWRKLHNTELHAMYSSPDIIRNIKSRRLRWAGHVARMDEFRNAYRVLVGRTEGKRSLA